MGGTGLSFDDLPVPRVIVARSRPAIRVDPDGVARRVCRWAPTASVDDHRAWIERCGRMTGGHRVRGVGILALVIVATIISVSFARAVRWRRTADRRGPHFVGAGTASSPIASCVILSARPAGRRDRGGVAMLRSVSPSRSRLVFGQPGRGSVRGLARALFAAPVGLSGAGGAGGADRGDHAWHRGGRCSPPWMTSSEVLFSPTPARVARGGEGSGWGASQHKFLYQSYA